MKRKIALILAFAMILGSLAGCSDKNADLKTDAEENKEEVFNINGIDPNLYVTKLGEYKGLEISAEKQEITDEDVESAIEYILNNNQEEVEVTDRAVQNGDVVNIDFEGKKDGVAFDGGTAAGYDLTIGSGTFISGFEDGLIGKKIGETVDLPLTFPDNYASTELAGQAVVFTVTINSITELKVPELTDEFVKNLQIDGCNTVEDFRLETRAGLESSAERSYRASLQTAAMDALMPDCEVTEDIPEDMLSYYRDLISGNIENEAANYGMGVLDFVSLYYGMDEEQYQAQIDTNALESTRQALVCLMIAQKEGLMISDDLLDEAIEENYASFGYASADDYKENGALEEYRNYLMTTKVLDFLVDNAVVTQEDN